MDTTWVLAADASRARLFESSGRLDPLREIHDFVNPEGRAKDRDLVSDGQGRHYGKGERNQGHTAPPRTDRVEHDVEMFAKSLADFLDKARATHRYDKLHLIAPPKFLGRLRGSLHKEVQKRVVGAIDKDVSRDDPQSILELIAGQR